MGIWEFFIVVLVCCGGALVVTWALAYFGEGKVPSIIPKIVWGVAILIIVFTLVYAFGLTRFDPKIPSVR